MPAKKTKTTVKPKVEVKHWEKDEIELVQGPNFPVIYTNNVSIAFNNWDAALIFGEIVEASDKLRVMPKVRVTVSLPFLIELRDLLNRNVEVFERNFGKIQTVGIDTTNDSPDS